MPAELWKVIVIVVVSMATMSQCALAFSGMSVVLCARIVALSRFWCLGISGLVMKNESEQSNAAVCEGR